MLWPPRTLRGRRNETGALWYYTGNFPQPILVVPLIPNATSNVPAGETASAAGRRPAAFLGRLSTPRLACASALVGMLLSLPALWTGFAQDDYFFLMIFKGSPGLEFLDLSPLDTFSFSKGDPEIQGALMERGYLPWWTAEGWKVNFWRPVAALSHWADYRLFGENAWPMHLHSLLLYGFLIAIAALLYRRFITSPWAAGLAALLFAIDSGHSIPAAWLAMRNALIALFFGLLVLWAHDRWRRVDGKWWPHGPLALLWLVLALLSAEAAVAVGGYLLGYALFLDPAARRWADSGSAFGAGIGPYIRSIGTLLPYLAVVILWRLAYSHLGFGTEGSGLYIDPVADSGEFLRQLPARMTVSLLGLFALPDATLWSLAPAAVGHTLLVLALLFIAAAAWAFRPLLRDEPAARFLLLGAVLAIVPACATLPMDRNLMFSSFGGLGVVAMYLARPATMDSPRIRGGLVALFIIAHIVVAPLGLITGTQQLPMMNRILTDSNPSIPLALPAATRIVAINTPTDLLGASLPIHRAARVQPVPEHWWWLYAGVGEVAVERTGERGLTLRPEGAFIPPTWAQVFRLPANNPMHAGDRVALDGLAIEVLSVTGDGRPAEVRFDFDVRLEDSSLYFVHWQEGTYLPFEIPEVGGTTHVPGTQLTAVLPIALGRKTIPN